MFSLKFRTVAVLSLAGFCSAGFAMPVMHTVDFPAKPKNNEYLAQQDSVKKEAQPLTDVSK